MTSGNPWTLVQSAINLATGSPLASCTPVITATTYRDQHLQRRPEVSRVGAGPLVPGEVEVQPRPQHLAP